MADDPTSAPAELVESVPVAAAVSATVTPAADAPDARITLYDAAGREIQVKASDAVTFLQQGWEREPLDPAKLAGELPALAQSAGAALAALHADTAERGAVSPSEGGAYHAAREALTAFDVHVQRFFRGLHASYPVEQPTDTQEQEGAK